MRLKEFEIFEAATAGATSSGNIAVVANPHVAHSKQKPKKVKPTDNALDMDVPYYQVKTLLQLDAKSKKAHCIKMMSW